MEKLELKIAAISDTHRMHLDLTTDIEATNADLLIHSGDGDCIDEHTTKTFLTWLNKVAEYFPEGALFTPGNHDTYFKGCDIEEIEEWLSPKVKIIINESIEVRGHKIFLSPCSVITPGFDAFGFPEPELKKVWDMIPQGTDLLVTHTPPRGQLDDWYGSISLMDKIKSMNPRVKVSLFGHIHGQYGVKCDKETGVTFVNASTVGTIERGPFVPLVITLFPDGRVSVSQPGQLNIF